MSRENFKTKSFNAWVKLLHKNLDKSRQKLGSSSDICCKNEFKMQEKICLE